MGSRAIAPEKNCPRIIGKITPPDNSSPDNIPRAKLTPGKLTPQHKVSREDNSPRSNKLPSKSTTSELRNYALSTSTIIKESFCQKVFFKAAT